MNSTRRHCPLTIASKRPFDDRRQLAGSWFQVLTSSLIGPVGMCGSWEAFSSSQNPTPTGEWRSNGVKYAGKPGKRHEPHPWPFGLSGMNTNVYRCDEVADGVEVVTVRAGRRHWLTTIHGGPCDAVQFRCASWQVKRQHEGAVWLARPPKRRWLTRKPGVISGRPGRSFLPS